MCVCVCVVGVRVGEGVKTSAETLALAPSICTLHVLTQLVPSRHARMRTAVAVKLLLVQDKRNVERFREEAKLMRKLNHPNIISLIGVLLGKRNGLLIEYAALGNLRKVLRNPNLKLTWSSPKTEWLEQIARGVSLFFVLVYFPCSSVALVSPSLPTSLFLLSLIYLYELAGSAWFLLSDPICCAQLSYMHKTKRFDEKVCHYLVCIALVQRNCRFLRN